MVAMVVIVIVIMRMVVTVRVVVVTVAMVMMVVVVVVVVVVGVTVIMAFRRAGADPFDMVMMAFLVEPDLRLKAQNLVAVLAHLAVHVAGALEDLVHPVNEGIDHQRMIVEVPP